MPAEILSINTQILLLGHTFAKVLVQSSRIWYNDTALQIQSGTKIQNRSFPLKVELLRQGIHSPWNSMRLLHHLPNFLWAPVNHFSLLRKWHHMRIVLNIRIPRGIGKIFWGVENLFCITSGRVMIVKKPSYYHV